MRLHLTHREIPTETVDAARDLFRACPLSAYNEDEQAAIAQNFVNRVCGDGVAVIHIGLTGGVVFGQPIYMPRFRFIDLFSSVAGVLGVEDTIGWAHSLYYLARPSMYRRAARRRLFRDDGVTAKDTFTTATWNALVQAGLTRGNEITDLRAVEEFLRNPSALDAEPEAELVPLAQEADPELERLLAEEEEIEARERGTNIPSAESEGIVAPAIQVPTFDDQAVSANEDGLDGLNRDALRRLASRHNIPGRGSMLAPQLRAALREAGVRA